MSTAASPITPKAPTVISPLGTYTLTHLPQDPTEVPNVKTAHELLLAAEKIRGTAFNDPTHVEENLTLAEENYRTAHDLFVKVLCKLPWEMNATFPPGWAKVYKWHAWCALGLNKKTAKLNQKELEAGEQSWNRYLEISKKNLNLSKEDQEEVRENTRDFFLRLTKLLISHHSYSSALAKLSQGIKLVGESVSLLQEKSSICLKQERYSDVITIFETIEKIYTNRAHSSEEYEPAPYVPYSLAIFFQQVGNCEKAEKYLLDAIAQNKALADSSMQQNIQTCEALLAKIALMKKGIAHWKQLIANDSHSCFQALYANASKKFEDMFHLAVAFMQIKRPHDAFICAKKAEELAGKFSSQQTTQQHELEAHFLLSSLIARELPSFNENARSDLCDAIEYWHNNSPHTQPNFHFALGIYYKYAAKVQSAREHIRLALDGYQKETPPSLSSQEGVKACKLQLAKIEKLELEILNAFQNAAKEQEKTRKSSKESNTAQTSVANNERRDLSPPASLKEGRDELRLALLLQNQEKSKQTTTGSSKIQEICQITAITRKKFENSLSDSVRVIQLWVPTWTNDYVSKLPYEESYHLAMAFKRYKSFSNAEICLRHAKTLATTAKNAAQQKECESLLHVIEKEKKRKNTIVSIPNQLPKNLSDNRILRTLTPPPSVSSSSLGSSSATSVSTSPSITVPTVLQSSQITGHS